MVSEGSSDVQVYIMCKVGNRIYAVGKFIGVLNKHLSLSYEYCSQECFTATTSG